MKPKNIFKNSFDGPFPFKYRKDKKFSRPCYIINGYESGLFNLFCPEIKIGEITYPAEFNLGRALNHHEDEFVAFGKNHYLN